MLSKLVFMMGAIDCASQANQMTDREFGALGATFLRAIEVPDAYSSILFQAFLKMDQIPAVRRHIIEGGQVFAEWMKGNSMVAFSAYDIIMKAVPNPEFPDSPGHLYVRLNPTD